jgi:hypothetical protein
VERDQPLAHDLLDEVGVAAAEVAVVGPDRRHAAVPRLADCDFRGAVGGDVADVVAAVEQRGRRRLVHDAHGRALAPGPLVARDREQARQPREAIAAQGVVHELVDDNARILAAVSDAPERLLAELGRLGDRQPHRVGPVGVERGR